MNANLSSAQIDLSLLSHNLKELRRVTKPSAMLMAVVKANAYGHGAVEVARQACIEKVDWLGVANISEGMALRGAGVTLPILIFGYTPGEMAKILLENQLTPTVFTFEMAKAFSQYLSTADILNIHVKMDTGMGRLGMVVSNEAHSIEKTDEIKKISKLKGIQLQGIYTHFANADAADKSYTHLQLDRFLHFLDKLKSQGITPEIAHAANSAALIDCPETHLDMVRPGISIYGSYPSETVDKSRVSLKPVMTFKTTIVHLKQVPKGFKVSYNMTYETNSPTLIATVPIGYADGYNRLLSSKGHMIVRGKKVPVVGRVCMDLTLLDVGQIPDVRVGDEVVVFGNQQGESILAEELATSLDTISYEIFTRVGERIERSYVAKNIV